MQIAVQPGIAEGTSLPDGVAEVEQAALACSGAQPLSVQQLAGLAIRAADFDAAVKKVQPSVRREGFATTPDVTWNDVGSLAEVRFLQLLRITHPKTAFAVPLSPLVKSSNDMHSEDTDCEGVAHCTWMSTSS